MKGDINMVVKRVRDLKEFRADSELKRCYQVFGALVAGDDEGCEWIMRNLYEVILREVKQ